uniref:Uncharacterized protein n=1 Tax=Hucho hucho TaxID=62062 RepID=A0A4W5KJ25_9TELE
QKSSFFLVIMGYCFTYFVIEGETLSLLAFHDLSELDWASLTEFTWYRNRTQELPSEEEHVDHHGQVLFFLPLAINDSAQYHSVLRTAADTCLMFVTEVIAYKASESAYNIAIPCPDCMEQLCQRGKGHLTWHKVLNMTGIGPCRWHCIVLKASKEVVDIYACVCTWEHSGRVLNTSASRRLKVQINLPRDGSTENTDLCTTKKLKFEAFCGQGIEDNCHRGRGIFQSGSSSTAILTMTTVTMKDLQSEFKCVAMNDQKWISAVVTLNLFSVCGLLLFLLLAAVVVMVFAIDLALLFRGVFKHYGRSEDGKFYDAYVFYQMDGVDKGIEERVCHFVSSVLPTVLEQKCGFRLFIHGRDDLPRLFSANLTCVNICMNKTRFDN